MTAVEWLINYFLEYGYNFGLHKSEIEQAKEMEKQKQDEFAIGFYNWMQDNYCQVGDGFVKDLSIGNSKGVIITTEKALEIYKKEKEL